MYRKFYGLINKPFELAPSSDIVYLSEAHKEGIATLRYGVMSSKGFLLLTGGVGAGKTTILNNLLGMVKKSVLVCVLNNPRLTRDEFFSYIGVKFGIGYNGNKGQFILKFLALIEKYARKNGKILLIIDEAQAFPVKLLEEIRLLSNHAGELNVFSIFLIGQPEILDVLEDPRLLPLRQRIGISYHLEPLSKKDTSQYITYRLTKAGATNQALFTAQAIEAIHEASKGNARLINVICDHALINGFNQDKLRIDREIITETIQQIRLHGEKDLRVSEFANSSDRIVAASSQKYRRWRNIFVLIVSLAALTAGILFYFMHK